MTDTPLLAQYLRINAASDARGLGAFYTIIGLGLAGFWVVRLIEQWDDLTGLDGVFWASCYLAASFVFALLALGGIELFARASECWPAKRAQSRHSQ